MKKLTLSLVFLTFSSCLSYDNTLEKFPKPGLVGQPDYQVAHDNAHQDILIYQSNAPEQQIRSAFESYCLQRGLHKSDRVVLKERTWFESQKESFGIEISKSPQNDSLLEVTIYHST